MKTFIIVILSVVSIIILFVISILITGKLYDKWALKAAEKYCYENELEFIEAKLFPNHYGLYFKKNGKKFYASYDFKRDRTITWKKETPLDKIAKKQKS